MVPVLKRGWISASLGTLLLGGTLLYGCGAKESNMTNFSKSSTDIKVLSKFIKLPIEPKSAVWQVLDPSHGKQGMGPSDWSLLAVMTFETEVQTLFSQGTQVAPHASIVSPQFQDLMDPQIRDMVKKVLPNPALASWRSGEEFFRQPLSQGYFVLVPETNQVVLCLFTM